MAVRGKEVNHLRQIRESIWKHWFQEHGGTAGRNLLEQLHWQKFQPSQARKPENIICSNSDEFCLAKQQIFIVERTYKGTEDIFSTYFSHGTISKSFKNCTIISLSFEFPFPQT